MTRRRKPTAPKSEEPKVEEPKPEQVPSELIRDLSPIQAMRIERNRAQRMALEHEFEARLAKIEADDKALEIELAAQWGIDPEKLRSSLIEIDFSTRKVRIAPKR